jgi:hypothetical protein
MREVRRAIHRPIADGAASALSRKVAHLLDDVRAKAGEAGLTVRSLPGPSRRAYEYLASVDWERAWGLVDRDATAAAPPLRIARVVSARDRFLRRLRTIASSPTAEAILHLKSQMQEAAAEVAIVCERAGSSPASLPDPSRRAYQWMSFLADGDNLEIHLRAQAYALRVDPRADVDLFHLSGLYRFAWKLGAVELTVSEAILDAPPAVLTAVVKLALPYTRKKLHGSVVRAYAASPAFERRLLQLETAGGSFAEQTHGLVFDLEVLFADVNARQFGGRLTRPRLSWMATTSLREFGVFVPATDLVLISSQLDSAEVPPFVVEHVLHHELLHRLLGGRLDVGRRVYHTPAFRRQERSFPRYAEADSFLQAMARRTRA